MRADDKKIANNHPGRESVRLVSNDLFGDGVYIFDIDHIPLGCGTVRFLFARSASARLIPSVPLVAGGMDNNSSTMALGWRNRRSRRSKFPGGQIDSRRSPTPNQLFYSPQQHPQKSQRRFSPHCAQLPRGCREHQRAHDDDRHAQLHRLFRVEP